MNRENVLLAGATGYLGSYILSELLNRQYEVRVVVRSPGKIDPGEADKIEVIDAQVTEAESIRDCCEGIDVVISTVGITRQKDGLKYMDVDYQANKNFLDDALKHGVKKFIYVSVFLGRELLDIKVVEAKERFVDELKESAMDYCIIRPNGFFSDMEEIYKMAQNGRVYLIGDGEYKLNPIHGKDLAPVCVDAIGKTKKEIEVGGPEIFSQNEIASIAFDVVGKEKKISHFPEWTGKLILFLIRLFTTQKTYGPVEFFLKVMLRDIVAPKTGEHTLREFYTRLKENNPP